MDDQTTYLTQNNIIFSLDHNLNTASIVGTNYISGDVLIPQFINYNFRNYIVISINEESFKNAAIRSISFEDKNC